MSADEFDITSLRERLQNVDLDLGCDWEIFLQRWKDYLRITAATTTNTYFYH